MQEGTGARQRHSWAVFGAVEAQREVCGTQCKAGRKGREGGFGDGAGIQAVMSHLLCPAGR